jgi:hypothetical protein
LLPEGNWHEQRSKRASPLGRALINPGIARQKGPQFAHSIAAASRVTTGLCATQRAHIGKPLRARGQARPTPLAWLCLWADRAGRQGAGARCPRTEQKGASAPIKQEETPKG